jgi:hypothetical protein
MAGQKRQYGVRCGRGAFLYRYWFIKDSSFKDFRLPSIAPQADIWKGTVAAPPAERAKNERPLSSEDQGSRAPEHAAAKTPVRAQRAGIAGKILQLVPSQIISSVL